MACPVCSSRSIDDFNTIKSYRLVQCSACGLIYCENPPSSSDETTEFYEHLYSDGEKYEGYGAPDILRSAEFSRRLEQIDLLQSGGRLLDIGCATGEFLEAAVRTGRYVCDGIDISPEAARQASARLRKNIYCGTVDAFPAAPGSYDIVTAWEVIEHMTDPVKFVRNVRRLLTPNGIFCLSTPNAHKISLRFSSDKRKLFFIPPEHLFYFSKPNLIRLLENSGFSPVIIEASSKRFLKIPENKKNVRRLWNAVSTSFSFIGIEGYNLVAFGRKAANGS